jgi:hypothetical protein
LKDVDILDVYAADHATLTVTWDGAVEVDWVGVVDCHDEGLASDVETRVECILGGAAGSVERSGSNVVIVGCEVEG